MIKVICDMCGREIPRYDRIKLKPEYDQMLVPMEYSEYLNSYDLHMDCYRRMIEEFIDDNQGFETRANRYPWGNKPRTEKHKIYEKLEKIHKEENQNAD